MRENDLCKTLKIIEMINNGIIVHIFLIVLFVFVMLYKDFLNVPNPS